MIVPVWVSHEKTPEKEILTYALLDTQSDTSFILDDTKDALGLQGTKTQLLLSTMSVKNQVINTTCFTGVRVRGYDSAELIPLPTVLSRNIIPVNRTHIPTPETANRWPHLKPIASKLMPPSDCDVGLLIGYNCSRALAPKEVILPTATRGPFAQKTELGWSIIGVTDSDQYDSNDCDPIGVSHRIVTYEVLPPISDLNSDVNVPEFRKEVSFSLKTNVKEIAPKDVIEMMEVDFSERRSNDYSQDDMKFISILENGIRKRDDNHYEMPLPFRDEKPVLPNNKILAETRLTQLKKRFSNDSKYQKDYVKFMDNIIEKGFAERVPECELNRNDGQTYYIPHHGVYHLKKNKIRVVFDCSAKFKGESLNDHLLSGPSLTNTLLGVLCRFRHEQIAFTCDIEQMFYQFKVSESHRNFLRFLWWDNGDYTTPPKEYRMNVHLFGAASSPGCANFGLKRIATDNENEYGTDTTRFIHRNFYVDDGLKSVADPSEAIDLANRAKGICSEGGVRLHKFVSNSEDVMKSLAPEDLASGVQDLNLLKGDLSIERALGVQWCLNSDQFAFQITLKDQPCTRRGILSTVSSIYDPLGFLAPVLLEGKLILQEMCRDKLDWDSHLPERLRSRWERWRNSLFKLEELQIQRCFKPRDFGKVVRFEIHHFSDASSLGYGQCSYLRVINDQNEVHCSFIKGKARVAPLKVTTIPRLELTAALISVKISHFLQDELDLENVTETFWTDSQVVLGYIANDARRFHVFVANRVQQIRNHSDPSQWNYVSSNENPADEASRGVTVEEFLEGSKWISGPKFLWELHIPEKCDSVQIVQSEDPELKKIHSLATHSMSAHTDGFELERLDYFSSWYRAKRAVALCLKFKDLMMNKIAKKRTKTSVKISPVPITVNEIRSAELEIVKQVQKKAFPEELQLLKSLKCDKTRQSIRNKNQVLKRSSSLFRLDPFVDEMSILRVGGRLRHSHLPNDVKHPIILPRNGHISNVVIAHFHKQVAHQRRSTTVNEIRQNGFWIIGCTSAVSEYIYKCVHCRRLRGCAQGQKMADLPLDRIEPTPPFTYVGVDFFGPWYVKEGRKELKRYRALFTCLVSRAVHVEVAVSLSKDSFINALRRFLSIRGPMRLLRSDCGTNFVGSLSEQKRALAEIDQNHIKSFLLTKGCDYVEHKLNVPAASHMGGAWERQIRTVRNVLNSLLQQSNCQLDDDSLRTLMYEVTAIINSRPLNVDNVNDPLSLTPISPNQILTMKSEIILPPLGKFDQSDLYAKKQWRRVQHLANEFWKRWQGEYLQNLQVRQKWTKSQPNLETDDIVIVRDDDLPRCQWRLGRVVETYPSRDGLVRSVKLLIGTKALDKKGKPLRSQSFLKRPVHKLVLLLKGN